MTDLSQMFSEAATIDELVGMMNRSRADSAKFVLYQAGVPTGAVILVRGEDTQAFLQALAQKERELEVMREMPMTTY